jgi:hypothetical protein
MRTYVKLAVALLVLSASTAAVAGQLPCGTAQLRQLHPIEITPFHGPFPGGRGAPTIGEERDFWHYDLSVMPPKNAQVKATCRGVSELVAIWIADDQWESEVTQNDVDSAMAAMESATPLTEDSGIVANNELLFGAPPKYYENDPEVTLLVYELEGFQGSIFDGYFRAEDLGPFISSCTTNPQLYCSNELAMVHVNSIGFGTDYMNGVVAHEYEHLAHFGQDPYEESWLNETMAELAMVYSGYKDPGNLKAYIDNPALPLVSEPKLVNYGACYLFGSYLHDRLGVDGVKGLVASSQTGISSIDDVMPHGGFDVLFGEFAAANMLDDPELEEGQFGHSLIDFQQMQSSTFGSSATKEIDVQPSGLSYVQLFWQMGDSETYQVTFDAKGTTAQAYAVHLPTSNVWALTNGQPVELHLFDDPTVVFAIANPDPAAKVTVSLAIEIVEGEYPVVEEPVVVEEPLSSEDVVSGDVTDDIGSTGSADSIPNDSGTPSSDLDSGSTESGSGCTTGGINPVSAALLLLLLVTLMALPRSRSSFKLRS